MEHDDVWADLAMTANDLSEYYSEMTGYNVEFGTEYPISRDIYVSAPRTKGQEWFENFADAEDRIKLLYPEVFTDDFDDPLEGLI